MIDKQPDWAGETAATLLVALKIPESDYWGSPEQAEKCWAEREKMRIQDIAAALRKAFKRGEASGMRLGAKVIDDGAEVAADVTIGPFLREMAKLFRMKADKIEKGIGE